MKSHLSFLVLAGCLSTPTVVGVQPASSPDIQTQQRAAAAQNAGYPTRKSAQELDAVIGQQTKDFKPTGKKSAARLEAFAAYTIDAIKGTCYTVVMRLGAGASWDVGAEGGLRFDFHTPTGQGSGGPGVTGPGAVVSVGCAESTGPITLTMTPLIFPADPIGKGPVALELFSHALTKGEATHLEADKQRQIAEQREFARREEERKQQRATAGCAKCDARFQGCIGAGRSRSSCDGDYRSCAFEAVGPDYLSSCPHGS